MRRWGALDKGLRSIIIIIILLRTSFLLNHVEIIEALEVFMRGSYQRWELLNMGF